MDLVTVDKARFNDAITAYFLWKELDLIIRQSHTRGVNIPETVTEALLCYVSGFRLNRGVGGDAFDPSTNRVIEIKATSNFERDTSSFSPNEEFDKLFFSRLDKRNDTMYFYDLGINSDQLKLIKVNALQTLGDQQKQGRRPRFSIIKQIIEPNAIDQYAVLDLRTKKITRI
ncbi:Bsp6I family type II restriction endonuclease [Bacillus sp. es.034]|uniref:Bsp6I family type II restriction endonuclease n=1 Tax=Bacillus sp. es.034 TaxID=1761763 RepID=UPI000BF7BCBB|nr:Bsp6I family type II restriction endonuclease [Bacillus sp. es.034]PFG07155.1 Bsp6I restriction endonuclease [Bacillus sp. es.034]